MKLTSNQIQEIIPHRYPFLFIDWVEELEPGKRCKAIKNVSSNEMHFLGHFPQEHVMPGVLIVEALAQTGAVSVLSLEENKGKIDKSFEIVHDIEKEIEIAKAQLEKEGKPAKVIEHILPGKIAKFEKDSCLTKQEYVKAEKKEDVETFLNNVAKKAGGKAKLVEYIRYEMGEGLTKNGCTLAQEVAASLA